MSTSGRHETHGAFELAGACNLHFRRLPHSDPGETGFRHLGIELDLAAGDNAEEGLARTRHEGADRNRADARAAAAHETVGRRFDLSIAAAPDQLAPLGLDLPLLGLREVQVVLGRGELRRSGLGGGVALVVDTL